MSSGLRNTSQTSGNALPYYAERGPAGRIGNAALICSHGLQCALEGADSGGSAVGRGIENLARSVGRASHRFGIHAPKCARPAW